MTPAEYALKVRDAALANECRRLAALELRAAILRGEAAGWSAFDRSRAYETCIHERSQLPLVQAYDEDRTLWFEACSALARLAEVTP